MSGRLPREVDPIRLADEGIRLQGELAASGFARLAAVLPGGRLTEPVAVDLRFERGPHGERLLRGTVSTVIEATCQRCLAPVRIALAAAPCAVLVRSDDAAGAGGAAEVLAVEGLCSLPDLVEDELLLAMPMFARHGEGECTAPGAVAPRRTVSGERPNPFGALHGLKTRGSKR